MGWLSRAWPRRSTSSLRNSHPLFFPPIVVSAWYGGIGPGLLAVFLSILGNSFHLTPAGFSLRFASLHNVIYILVWSFTALFVAWLTAKHREVVASLRNNEAKLEEAQRVAHVGYWENDLDTDRITWSDEIYHILGPRPKRRFSDCGGIPRADSPGGSTTPGRGHCPGISG